jgi:hypothetical protein
MSEPNQRSANVRRSRSTPSINTLTLHPLRERIPAALDFSHNVVNSCAIEPLVPISRLVASDKLCSAGENEPGRQLPTPAGGLRGRDDQSPRHSHCRWKSWPYFLIPQYRVFHSKAKMGDRSSGAAHQRSGLGKGFALRQCQDNAGKPKPKDGRIGGETQGRNDFR